MRDAENTGTGARRGSGRACGPSPERGRLALRTSEATSERSRTGDRHRRPRPLPSADRRGLSTEPTGRTQGGHHGARAPDRLEGAEALTASGGDQ